LLGGEFTELKEPFIGGQDWPRRKLGGR